MTGVFLGWLGALLEACRNASAAMPVLVTLGLAAGRRGNAALCLAGNRVFARLALIMAVLGVIYFPYAYWLQIYAFNGSAADAWAPFFALPGLPWSSSMLMQLAGTILLLLGAKALEKVECAAPGYAFSLVKKPAVFFLWGAACFFATFFLIHWPFAGLPQGLPLDRAIFAVMRNAARHYFMAFTPAGAIALAMLYKTGLPGRFPEESIALGCRWLAFWACVGIIPQTGQEWAILLGLGLRGNAASYFPGGLGWHLAGLCLLTGAISLWFAQALLKKTMKWLAILALALYLLQISLPYMRKMVLEPAMPGQISLMGIEGPWESPATGVILEHERSTILSGKV